jgi:hypothetical protein
VDSRSRVPAMLLPPDRSRDPDDVADDALAERADRRLTSSRLDAKVAESGLRLPAVLRHFGTVLAGPADVPARRAPFASSLSFGGYTAIHNSKQVICQKHNFQRFVRFVEVYLAVRVRVFVRSDRSGK